MESKKKELVNALKSAQEEGTRFPDEQFIYSKPIKKHEHYSIPAGTIHCSGKNSVVLEISSTPNRFTFKLWDWDRVDLDGLPRPIHLNHGENSIKINRDEEWVEKEICDQVELVIKGDGWREEKKRDYTSVNRLRQGVIGSVRKSYMKHTEASTF